MSLFGIGSMGAALSICDYAIFGSSMSIRNFVLMGSTMSIQGNAYIDGQLNVGSAFSLRSYARLGSALSVFGVTRLGSTLSLLDKAVFGSSLSMRNWCRLGGTMSIIDYGRLGSSLSLRSCARFGSSLSICGVSRVGGTMSVHGDVYFAQKVVFGSANTYMYYDSGSSELKIVANGNTRVSIGTGGGTLHGIWSSESIISASDRRLKRQIEPLHRALAQSAEQLVRGDGKLKLNSRDEQRDSLVEQLAQSSAEITNAAAAGSGQSKTSSKRQGAVDWLLRQLRPVSFTFRGGLEAKTARYGFVAQEVEQILPDLVQTHNNNKHVAYLDMIALLTLASQVQQDRLLTSESRSESRRARLSSQAQRLKRAKRGIAALGSRISRWENVAIRRLSGLRKANKTSSSRG